MVCDGIPLQRSESVPQGPAEPDLPVTVIERRPGWQLADLRELWGARELLLFLVWRDVKVRYKQTALGAAWAVLQPLATMLVFTGFLPWTLFSNAISSASQSVVGSQNLVTKVYFPRLVIPLSAVGASLID